MRLYENFPPLRGNVHYPRIGAVVCADGTTITPSRDIIYPPRTYSTMTSPPIAHHVSKTVSLRNGLLLYDTTQQVLDWAVQHHLTFIRIVGTPRFADPPTAPASPKVVNYYERVKHHLALKSSWSEYLFNRSVFQPLVQRFFQHLIDDQEDVTMLKECFLRMEPFATSKGALFVHTHNLPPHNPGEPFALPYGTPYAKVFAHYGVFSVETGFMGSLNGDIRGGNLPEEFTRRHILAAVASPSPPDPIVAPPPATSWRDAAGIDAEERENFIYRTLQATPEDTILHIKTAGVLTANVGENLWNTSEVLFVDENIIRTPVTVGTPPDYPASQFFLPFDSPRTPPTRTVSPAPSDTSADTASNSGNGASGFTSTPFAHHPPSELPVKKKKKHISEESFPYIETLLGSQPSEPELPYSVTDFGFSFQTISHTLPYWTGAELEREPFTVKNPPICGAVSGAAVLLSAARTVALYNQMVALHNRLVGEEDCIPIVGDSKRTYTVKYSKRRVSSSPYDSQRAWYYHAVAPSHGKDYAPAWVLRNTGPDRWGQYYASSPTLQTFFRLWDRINKIEYYRPEHLTAGKSDSMELFPLPGAPFVRLFPRHVKRKSRSHHTGRAHNYFHITVAGFYHDVSAPACVCEQYNTDPLSGGPVGVVPLLDSPPVKDSSTGIPHRRLPGKPPALAVGRNWECRGCPLEWGQKASPRSANCRGPATPWRRCHA